MKALSTFLTGIRCVFTSRPSGVTGSPKCRETILRMLDDVLGNEQLAETVTTMPRFLERGNRIAVGWKTKEPFRRRMNQFWKRRNISVYRLGPCGWSGDMSVHPDRTGLSFVGLREDILDFVHKIVGTFALRHEMQHEVQRVIYGVSDAICERYPQIRACAELDANYAALTFLKVRKQYRLWHPTCWEWMAFLSAHFSGLPERSQKLTVLCILVTSAILCVFCVTVLPTKVHQCVGFMAQLVGIMLLILRILK